jgi:hypothetical protein
MTKAEAQAILNLVTVLLEGRLSEKLDASVRAVILAVAEILVDKLIEEK